MVRTPDLARAIFDHVELERLAASGLDRQRHVPSVTELHRVAMLYIAARERDWALNTRINHVHYFGRVCRIIGPVEVGDLDWPHVWKFVDVRRRQGVKESTVTREYLALWSLLEWCARQGIVAENAMRKMRLRDFGLPSQYQFNRPREYRRA
jgi:hypothetical protein